MHLCRSTGWVDVVLVRLSWTTASRHGVVVHRQERAKPADRGQPQKASHRRSWRLSGLFRGEEERTSVYRYAAAQTQKWVRIKEARI
jgi:alkylhydroperoxidase family enzyme